MFRTWAALERTLEFNGKSRLDLKNISMTALELTKCLKEQDEQCNTPLHLACKSGDLSLVNLFLRVSKKLNLIGKNVQITEGSKCLLESKDDSEQTPLFVAVKHGHLEVVKILCKENKELADQKDYSWNTPLHIAAKCGKFDIVKELVIGDSKVEVNALNHANLTALDHAADAGHLEICEFLIDEGSEIDPKDLVNMTPLLLAAKNGHKRVLKMLLDNGANAKSKTQRNEEWVVCPLSGVNQGKKKKIYKGGLRVHP